MTGMRSPGAVGSLGRSLDDLETVLLTHAHSDHTGFAERARTDAHAVVRIHREDEAMARTGKGPKNESGVGRYLLRPEAYRHVDRPDAAQGPEGRADPRALDVRRR